MSAPHSPVDLSGHVTFVTGASSGLGQHFALTFARNGAKIAIAARRIDRLEALVREIGSPGGAILPVGLDVTDPTSVARAIDQTETKLGPIMILVNNASIAATRQFLDQNEADWRSVLETNLHGAWRVAHATAKRMVAHENGGAIINVVSILDLRPSSQVSAYAAAKAALINLTQSMAIELARYKIRVNVLAPGYVETDLNREFLRGPSGQAILKRIQFRRFGTAADLDGAMLLLASDAGRNITGHTIVVDGRHSLSLA